MAHILFSAAHKSSGKTTVTLGVCRALKNRGLTVQPFKKGPDYIDPLWLGTASGRPCHNLDFFTMSAAEIQSDFSSRGEGADISIIEGNKGLYDGLDLEGGNSNAALARMLAAPVILILDARGMTRGIAPLILGYQAFEANVNIAGVILNRIGGTRHEEKLRAIIEHYTDVSVIGAVHHDPALDIPERHLGLIPFNETAAAEHKISIIAERIATEVDLDRLLAIAGKAPALAAQPGPSSRAGITAPDVRIAIARDSA
ncbi:MAG: cobyrinate a,c-diamide synthase, partial [Rhodospirillales bacterium]|nr:cobyrinate a,c-diamide synthase [Rhodospirillales bacterium]